MSAGQALSTERIKTSGGLCWTGRTPDPLLPSKETPQSDTLAPLPALIITLRLTRELTPQLAIKRDASVVFNHPFLELKINPGSDQLMPSVANGE